VALADIIVSVSVFHQERGGNKMKALNFIMSTVASLTLLTGSVHAATISGGNHSGDVWYSAGTHRVTGVVTVIYPGYMGFAAGCTIQFDEDAGFVVQGGELEIGGLAGSQVVMERYSASDAWAGVRITSGTLDIENTSIEGAENTDGGGLYVSGGTVDFDEVEIFDCEATDEGGGIYVTGRTVTFDDCIVRDNTASRGGGVCLVNSANVTMNDCAITGNTSATNQSAAAGGFRVSEGDLTLNGCIVAGNSGYHGGIYIEGDSDPDLALDYCTVYGNEKSSGTGGIEIYEYTYGSIENSIIWGNEGTEIST